MIYLHTSSVFVVFDSFSSGLSTELSSKHMLSLSLSLSLSLLLLSEGGGGPRRTSSLPNVNDDTSAITLEDIHNIITEEEPLPPSTLRRQEDLRKSNRRLKERIQMQ